MPMSAWPYAIGEALLGSDVVKASLDSARSLPPPSLLPASPSEAICSSYGLLWLFFPQSFQNLPCVISAHSRLPPRFLCSGLPTSLLPVSVHLARK